MGREASDRGMKLVLVVALAVLAVAALPAASADEAIFDDRDAVYCAGGIGVSGPGGDIVGVCTQHYQM